MRQARMHPSVDGLAGDDGVATYKCATLASPHGPLTVQPAAKPLALNHEVSQSVLEVARLVPRQSIEQSRLWVELWF